MKKATNPSAGTRPRIRASGFFSLRTPLLPFSEFTRWSDGLQAPARLEEDDEDLSRAIMADCALLRERLAVLLDRADVREALFVASPDIAGALETWRGNPGSPHNRRIEGSLIRYFARMVARPTPFGLFAGCSVGRISNETTLSIEPLSSYRRHARFDIYYLTELVEAIARDPELRGQLFYRPNSSLYRLGGRLRYVESTTTGSSRSYKLVAVEDTPYLSTVLSRATQGATLRQLSECLATDEITGEEANTYLEELVEAQLLIPEILPQVTGPEPIHDLLSQLRQLPASVSVASRLHLAQQNLEALDQLPLGTDLENYRSIAASLQEIPVPVHAISKLFQVDMVKPAPSASLGQPVIAEIVQAVELLHGLQVVADPFQLFRERFRDRYERQEVPLLEVLDEENGLSLAGTGPNAEPSPLFEGLHFPAEPAKEGEAWSQLDSFLLGKLSETVAAGGLTLELKAQELERYKLKHRRPLPEAFSIFATLTGSCSQAVERGEFEVVLGSMVGPSGARLMGRFCHPDTALREKVGGHLRDEEESNPDAIYAEIVHLPEGRVGNVILRPLLRDYEIPYLGRSGAPEHRQIGADDLTVTVEDERVVLRSRRLRRQIIPRLTCAHNYSRGLGLYRFLCSLQQQHVTPGLAWSWGRLNAAPFLPRVIVGKAILARARWRIERRERDAMAAGDDIQLYRQVETWRKKRAIPRLVSLVDGDNKLLFDLENVLSAQTLMSYVRRRSSFVLEEFYPRADALCCSGPEGPFAHEIVLPMICRAEPAPRLAHTTIATVVASQARHFLPGSEWLYAKIYTGTANADRVLREVIAPLVGEMAPDAVIDRWFFVRYGDPHPHLRVRFHGSPSLLMERLLPRLQQLCLPLKENGALAKLQLDTYQREIERYGGMAAMLLAERFFHLSSESVLEILDLLPGDTGAEARWQIALVGMDMLLDDLGLDLEERLRIAKAGRAALLRQQRVDSPAFRRSLGNRFRKVRPALEQLLNTRAGSLEDAIGILRGKSDRVRSEVAAPLRAMEGSELRTPFQSIVSAYLHMHVNRFARTAGAQHELVFYDFLSRVYDSRLARLEKPLAQQNSLP